MATDSRFANKHLTLFFMEPFIFFLTFAILVWAISTTLGNPNDWDDSSK